ncbi:MAG TPA: C40 family peptidase [Actinomycetes bacterium]|nr:C40 family peptidase [Actinomycetes bacterium]
MPEATSSADRTSTWRGRALGAALAALLAAGLLGTAPPAAAEPAADLEARARATGARLDAQHQRLEILAERVNEATADGTALLARIAELDRRRRRVAREQAAAQAALTAHAHGVPATGEPGRWASWSLLTMANPVELADRLPRAMAELQDDQAQVTRMRAATAELERLNRVTAARVVDQARVAERLHRERGEAEALAARLQAEMDALDDRIAAAIDRQNEREEAARRAAFDRAAAAAGGAGSAAGGPSAAARRAVRVALAQLGDPYLWGAEGPGRFDCSGLTSFAYAAAGVAIPRTSRAQFAAYAPTARVPLRDLRPGDLVFFATDPAVPSTIHHVGMYVGRGLMVEAPHTGATVRTASVMRRDFAGAVRPTSVRGR